MASRGIAPRIAMYSHDTFGLGHLTRTLRIARAAVEALPEASVLVLTGSPIAHRLTFPDRVEYIKLPSVRKSGPEEYASRDLGIPFRRLRQMRVQIIRDTMRFFRPHLLFVDNVPMGMKGEVLPSLEELKRAGTALHLNFRDILDEPEVVRSQWGRDGTDFALESLYDEIHVFGDRSVHDSVRAYCLPAAKTTFHGYIAPPARGRVLPERRRNGAPSILVTIGGGEDGAETIRCVLEAERAIRGPRRPRLDLVLGPLMGCREAKSIHAAIECDDGVSARDFVEDLADFMPDYDLVVSMGGYNTLCEIMARARRSLVIPRTYPRREQELRARALASRGVLRMVHPSERTPERMRAILRDTLEWGPVLPSPGLPRLDGLESLKRRLIEIAASLREPDPRRFHAHSRRAKAATARARAKAVSAVLGLLVGLLLGHPATADASLKPREVNAELLGGYDTNILDASAAELRAFDTHDPSSYFVVDRMQDAAMTLSIDGKWALPLSGTKTDVRLRYQRLHYIHEPIRSENHYGLLWRSQPSPGTRGDISLEFAPKVYQRHRKDKDALPGEPMFRAEVRDEWDASAQIVRDLGPAWSSVFLIEGSFRDNTQPFKERDRKRAGGRTGLIWQPREGLKLDLSGGYRELRSRNVPYLGSDLSYREWSARSSLEATCFGGFLKLRAYANRDWLHYTSRDPGDQSHFGREDAEWDVGGDLQHALNPSLDWTATVAHHRHDVAAPGADASADLDEEGSSRDTFIATGFAWHWRP